MEPRWTWARTGGVVAVLAAATLLRADSFESQDFTSLTSGPLAFAGRLLTVPMVLSSPADVRWHVLLLGLSGVLLAWAARPGRVLPTAQPAEGLFRGRTRLELALGGAVGVVGVLAVLSALINGTWDWSRGWVFGFAVAGGWSLVLSRFDAAALVRIVRVLPFAISGCAALTLWHRHQLGLQYPVWPIGPVTVCAELAAVGVALGIGRAAVRPGRAAPASDSRGAGRLVLCILPLATLGLNTWLLIVSARRAAWLGLGVSVVVLAGAIGWRRLGSRAARTAIAVAGLAAAASAAAWVVGQSRHADPAVSGPLSLRYAYWRHMAALLPGHHLLGRGPEAFLPLVTTAMAPERAERPHALHGSIDLAAHNEWLQAAFELGIPAGLAYLAIPLLAIAACGVVCCEETAPWVRRRAAAAVAAGLLVIVVTEGASINLRAPMVWTWYWTLIGLALGLLRARGTASGAAGRASPPSASVASRLVAGGVAVAVLLLAFDEVQANRAHAAGRRWLNVDPGAAASVLELAETRQGVGPWLSVRTDLGAARLSAAESTDGDARRAAAVAAAEPLEAVVKLCPAFPRAAALLAEALRLGGRPDEATALLDRHVARVDPYDAEASLILAEGDRLSDAERLSCLRRSIRNGRIGERFLTVMRHRDADFTTAEWRRSVIDARHLLKSAAAPHADALAPETLRIEAMRAASAGQAAEAAELQALAAGCYQRWAEQHSARRRAAPAEADAWMRAAAMLFDADPERPQAALEHIRMAERFLVLGIRHEHLRAASPDAEFVGEQVVPTELPDEWRPLWRLSATLRLATGDERGLMLRLMSSLPPDRRNAVEARRVLHELATELRRRFDALPAERRPPTYTDILRLSESRPG